MIPYALPAPIAQRLNAEQQRINDLFDDITEAAMTNYHPEPRHVTAWRASHRKGDR